jgi:two-component system sensor histidine kinase AlgZ
MVAGQTRVESPRDFYIPNLCTAESVIIMFILAQLLVVVYVLGDSQLPSFDWTGLALASLFVQWIVLLCAAVLCAARKSLRRLQLPAGVLASMLIIQGVTVLCSLVASYLLAAIDYSVLDGWWVVRNQLMALLIGGVTLRYFFLQQEVRLREQAELGARLEALRARIRPHFLFNTMNSIASLIASRPQQAEAAVENLSELFRASLMEDNENTSVADELRLCRLYLDIEQLRLGERLRVAWQVDDALLTQLMPPLILQPLVENAVYHGVACLPQGGCVEIALGRSGDKLQVVVCNPLPPVGADHSSGHSMALDNIRQRLAVLFGNDASIDIERTANVHKVTLLWPVQDEL